MEPLAVGFQDKRKHAIILDIAKELPKGNSSYSAILSQMS